MNILCFGDSNTFGYNPHNGLRYNKKVRWTGILQYLLGDNFHVIEEGLNGRTTVFEDPIFSGRCGINTIVPCLDLHRPVDLLIIMLGTNDTREVFHADSDSIAKGLKSIVKKALSVPYNFRNNKPNVLIVSPLPIRDEVAFTLWGPEMSDDCVTKSEELAPKYKKIADELGCYFFDASPFGKTCDIDYIHLDEETHSILGHKIFQVVKDILL